MMVVEEKSGAMVSLKFIKSTTLCDIIKLCHLNVLFRDISIIFIALFVCHGNGPDTTTSDSAACLCVRQPTDSEATYMYLCNAPSSTDCESSSVCECGCGDTMGHSKQVLAGCTTYVKQEYYKFTANDHF